MWGALSEERTDMPFARYTDEFCFITCGEPTRVHRLKQFVYYSVIICVLFVTTKRVWRTVAQQWIIPCLFVAEGTCVWRAVG
jgi:hypothetical protein